MRKIWLSLTFHKDRYLDETERSSSSLSKLAGDKYVVSSIREKVDRKSLDDTNDDEDDDDEDDEDDDDDDDDDDEDEDDKVEKNSFVPSLSKLTANTLRILEKCKM